MLISSGDPFKKHRWFWQNEKNEKEEIIPKTSTPNQGILQSFKRILILFLIITSLCIIYFGVDNIAKSDGNLLKNVLIAGTAGFYLTLIVIPFTRGGIICIKHFILRVLLFFNGKIPWNYAKLLNYATNSILLQKIGGGYVFAHRLLLEHFAQIYDERS